MKEKPGNKYDVFINYNSRDSLAVDVLVARLEVQGVKCFRDVWDTVPGRGAASQLEQGIEASSVFVVFVGRHATGPWQARGIVTAFKKRVKGENIIPVFLPGLPGEEREKLVDFLQSPTHVVFKDHLDEKLPFELLMKAIKVELKKGDDAPWRDLENPYKGLHKFLEEDRERFFGHVPLTAMQKSELRRGALENNVEEQHAIAEAHRLACLLEQYRNNAEEQRTIAEARRLACLSLIEQNKHVDLSLLLAMASIQEMEATHNPALEESEYALRAVFQSHPRLYSYLHGHERSVESLVFSPDGRLLASASDDGTIILWDMEERKNLAALRHGYGYGVSHLSFSPDGNLLASACGDGTIILWDVKKQQNLAALHGGYSKRVDHLSFSLDGRLLAWTRDDKMITLWDVEKRQNLAALRGHSGRVEYLSFSPNGNLLALGDKAIILWDVEKQKKLATLRGHSRRVEHLSFSPDGNLLASASDDETIILWDVEKQKKLATLRGHEGRVSRLSFNSDGGLLASASYDGTIILWDVEERKNLATLRGHGGRVSLLSFSPDGHLLASACGDNTSASRDETIILWDVKKQQGFTALYGYERDRGGRSRALRTANRNMTFHEWCTYMGDRPYRRIFEDLPGPPDAPVVYYETEDGECRPIQTGIHRDAGRYSVVCAVPPPYTEEMFGE